jgi:predicted Zn-ribbon and HTH transcriptional regulator
MTSKATGQTIRQHMVALLSEGPHSTRDLSKILGICERDVRDHFPHIARSLLPQKRKLVTIPCRCLTCGFVFSNRRRYSRPSRCPRCRGERIQEPNFQVI